MSNTNDDNLHWWKFWWYTRPPNIEDKTFPKLFQNDIYKLMNICNPTCYKIYVDALKKLCMYGFLQLLINEIHLTLQNNYYPFFFDKWLNNANPWILMTLKCNHELKFIATSNKNSDYMYYHKNRCLYFTYVFFL
jgi:hypothetical protein